MVQYNIVTLLMEWCMSKILVHGMTFHPNHTPTIIPCRGGMDTLLWHMHSMNAGPCPVFWHFEDEPWPLWDLLWWWLVACTGECSPRDLCLWLGEETTIWNSWRWREPQVSTVLCQYSACHHLSLANKRLLMNHVIKCRILCICVNNCNWG